MRVSQLINDFLHRHPDLYWRLRIGIEHAPRLNLALLKLLYRRFNTDEAARLVSKDTEIVIEGYPRSANSFAHRAFRLAQYEGLKDKPLLDMLFEKKMKVATHAHTPSQIIMASKYGIPSIVLIRKPRDAVLSWKALDIENAMKGNDTALARADLSYYIKYYIWFYKSIYPYRKNFELATFEDVTKDYGKVIVRLNKRFKTSFRSFEHSKENEALLFSHSGKHLSPSASREKIKAQIEKDFKKPENEKLLREALSVYRSFVSKK